MRLRAASEQPQFCSYTPDTNSASLQTSRVTKTSCLQVTTTYIIIQILFLTDL